VCLYFLSFSSIIIYALFLAVGYPLFLIPFLGVTYDLIGTLPDPKSLRVEYIALREFYLNAGRFASVLLFFIFLLAFPEQRAIAFAIPILGSGHFIAALVMRGVNVTVSPHKVD
ncbi:MAG: MFS transporter, partial [Bacilli bacterium]